MRRPLFVRLLLAGVTLIVSGSGCTYARRWMARRDKPADARLVESADRTTDADAPPPKNGAVQLAGHATDTNDDTDSDAAPPGDERPAWQRLLPSLGRRPRIPLPRTDLSPGEDDTRSTSDFADF